MTTTASSTATRTTRRKSVSRSRESSSYVCFVSALTVRESISLEQSQASTNGVVAQLEAQVSADTAKLTEEKEESQAPEDVKLDEGDDAEEQEQEEDEEEDEEQEEEEDSDDVCLCLPAHYLLLNCSTGH